MKHYLVGVTQLFLHDAKRRLKDERFEEIITYRLFGPTDKIRGRKITPEDKVYHTGEIVFFSVPSLNEVKALNEAYLLLVLAGWNGTWDKIL